MRLGFLGTGTIATAVVQGIAEDGHQITVSRRSEARSAALARAHAAVTVAEAQEVIDRSEVVFLGLMAETAAQVLPGMEFHAGQKVISFMAGATLDEVAVLVRPAEAVAVMMPFPAIAQGGSAIMMQGDPEIVETLFGARNRVFVVRDSAELQAYLAAQAVLSPVTAMVGQAADWLGARVADPAQGEAFLRVLVSSSLEQSDCAALLEALNTPGGYNQRLRLAMEAAGMGATLKDGLDTLAQ